MTSPPRCWRATPSTSPWATSTSSGRAMPMPSPCAASLTSPRRRAPSMSPGRRRCPCAGWRASWAAASVARRASPAPRRRPAGSTTPRAWWPSWVRPVCRSSACSTGPPTGSCAAWRATASPRTTRCAMAAIDGAAGPRSDRPIERLAPADAEALCHLSIEAGWNQVAADWHLMLSLGQGFGVKDDAGRWVGSALALPLGSSIAWISMVLVTGPARGRGFGTRLLSRCIDEVESSERAAGLDATELGRPIYATRGFHDLFALSRWVLGPGPRDPVAPPAGVTIRSAERRDVPRLADYDYPRSGLERAAILGHLLDRAPTAAHIAEAEDGTIVGYALPRDARGAGCGGRRVDRPGPAVARHGRHRRGGDRRRAGPACDRASLARRAGRQRAARLYAYAARRRRAGRCRRRFRRRRSRARLRRIGMGTGSWEQLPADVLAVLRRGAVLPAHPLALDEQRRFDRTSQRALARYYIDAGAGGLAVGVHATQFAIREAGLYRPVLELAAETAATWGRRPLVMIAGAVGRTGQAVEEARLARALGYHAVLLGLGAMRGAGEDEIVEHCAAVAREMPLIGFYLQTAVGGIPLSRAFWTRFSAIDNVIAIKVAPFDRYRTLDVAF